MDVDDTVCAHAVRLHHRALKRFIASLLKQLRVGLQFATNEIFNPLNVLEDAERTVAGPKPKEAVMVFPGIVSTLDMCSEMVACSMPIGSAFTLELHPDMTRSKGHRTGCFLNHARSEM